MNAGEGHLPGTAPLQEGGDFGARMVAGLSAFLDRQLTAVDAQAGAALATPRSSSEREAAAHRRAGGAGPAHRGGGRPPADSRPRAGRHHRRACTAGRHGGVRGLRRALAGAPRGGRGRTAPAPAGRAAGPRGGAPGRGSDAGVPGRPDSGLPRSRQLARRLAEAGCRGGGAGPARPQRCLVRATRHWGKRPTCPHREFLWRMAFEVGRHPIGFEVQKVLALVDWLCVSGKGRRWACSATARAGCWPCTPGRSIPAWGPSRSAGTSATGARCGGSRSTATSGALLREFGDAELAALVGPASARGRGRSRPRRSPARPRGPGESPGRSRRPGHGAAGRGAGGGGPGAPGLRGLGAAGDLVLVEQGEERAEGTAGPGTGAALRAFLAGLGVGARRPRPDRGSLRPARARASIRRRASAGQLDQLVAFTQDSDPALRASARRPTGRGADTSSPEAWRRTSEPYRDYFWEEVIGRLPGRPACRPMPRTRQVSTSRSGPATRWSSTSGPDVFAYGILLLPQGPQAGERRPVVVCQHGLEGRPQRRCSIARRAVLQRLRRPAGRAGTSSTPRRTRTSARTRFRQLQRKANPLEAVALLLHRPPAPADPGLARDPAQRRSRRGSPSTASPTAARRRCACRPLLEDYCLSICSADFNEWVGKMRRARSRDAATCGRSSTTCTSSTWATRSTTPRWPP